MFKLENVSLIYDLDKLDNTKALININMEAKDNCFYSIVGPSGSGKSSLLYIMSGIKEPTSGRVFYNNEEIWELGEERLAALRLKSFGFVFQKHYLIPYLDILQNILIPVNGGDKEEQDLARQLLKELELEKHKDKRPYQLSGGQCQRVAIARALINRPKVLFADEITASLDRNRAEKVLLMLEEKKKEMTILFVTHDKAMAKIADEQIYIRDGKLGGVDEDESSNT